MRCADFGPMPGSRPSSSMSVWTATGVGGISRHRAARPRSCRGWSHRAPSSPPAPRPPSPPTSPRPPARPSCAAWRWSPVPGRRARRPARGLRAARRRRVDDLGVDVDRLDLAARRSARPAPPRRRPEPVTACGSASCSAASSCCWSSIAWRENVAEVGARRSRHRVLLEELGARERLGEPVEPPTTAWPVGASTSSSASMSSSVGGGASTTALVGAGSPGAAAVVDHEPQRYRPAEVVGQGRLDLGAVLLALGDRVAFGRAKVAAPSSAATNRPARYSARAMP